MHARVNVIYGNARLVDAGLDQLEATDRARVEATPGNRGLTTMVNREAGVIVAMSYWDEPLESSESALTDAREKAAAAAGGDLVVEQFEVAGSAPGGAPGPGAVAEMTRVRLDPTARSEGLAYLTTDMLSALAHDTGATSAQVLIDHDTGNGIIVALWAAPGAAERARRIVAQQRSLAEQRVQATFPRTETYTLIGTSPGSG